MSLNWTYLTKTPLWLRYRDIFATLLIGKWALGKYISHNAERSDSSFVNTRLYTHDESDIEFREQHNMADHAVRRSKMIEFADNIKRQRANEERRLMLDAYNYLNKRNHTVKIQEVSGGGHHH